MYVNSSRTVLAVISGLSLLIGVILIVAATATPDEESRDLWLFGGALLILGVSTLLAYLVARSVSYDTWYRSPDSAEWRAASDKAAAEKAAVKPAATVASDPAGSTE